MNIYEIIRNVSYLFYHLTTFDTYVYPRLGKLVSNFCIVLFANMIS